MKEKFTLSDIEEVLQTPKSWWAILTVLPFVRRISSFFANYTSITPNIITTLSLIIAIISAYMYSLGEHLYLIIGAALFQISYIFDCCDGTIARLKKNGSSFGKVYDEFTDSVKIVVVVSGIYYGQYKLYNNVNFLLVAYLFGTILLLHYFRLNLRDSFLNEFKNINESNNELENKNTIQKYLSFMKQRNYKIIPSAIEVMAFQFIIIPIALPQYIIESSFLSISYLVLVALQQLFKYYKSSK